jgi:threonine synthase
MEGILDLQYDYDLIAKVLTPGRLGQASVRTLWRYLPLLPVRGQKRVPPLEVGGTPLYDARALAQTVGMDQIWLKDESKNPTGSIEDRATAIAVTRALEDNYSMLTCGSTGNAALSSAALTAAVGLQTTLFVSREAPDGYVAQLLLLGPDVYVVEGGYEDAVRLSLRAAEEYGWYNRNTAVNPYLIEGEKTVAFELNEQMHGVAPDCVVVPVAEGSVIAAAWKGYCEMKRLGWISSLPKMIGVQAESAATIYAAWKEGCDPVAMRPDTIAESLAVGVPRDWRKAVAAVRDSGGMMVAVSDREILQAMHLLGERSGIIAEPGSAATLAGLVSLLRSRQLPRTISAVLLIAGGGLRHSAAAIEAAGKARTVPPDFEQVRMTLQRALSRTPF